MSYTLTVKYTDGCDEIVEGYETQEAAIKKAKYELKWESTVSATIKQDGKKIYSELGDFVDVLKA